MLLRRAVIHVFLIMCECVIRWPFFSQWGGAYMRCIHLACDFLYITCSLSGSYRQILFELFSTNYMAEQVVKSMKALIQVAK